MRTRRRAAALALTLLLGLDSVAPAVVGAEPPTVIGWKERMTLSYVDNAGRATSRLVTAKIDTGATTSSLDARDISLVEGDGRQRVRFTLVDEQGIAHALEADVIRSVRIRRAGAEAQRRPVVRLDVCVAGKSAPAEFTLVDRSGQEATALIGREFLAGRFLVDANAVDTAPDACSH